MSITELLTLLSDVTVDSLRMLRRIFADPQRARAYADAFDVPPVQPSPEWLGRVDSAAERLERKEYAQALADAVELVDNLATFLEDFSDGDQDVGVADMLRRMFLPVVLFCLRQDRYKEDDTKFQAGFQLAISMLLFLDDRAQETYAPPSSDDRWYQFGKDVLGKLDYDGPTAAPFAITDAFFVVTMILGLVFRGRIQRRLPIDEDLFTFFYGFEHPEDPAFAGALGALGRSATIGIASPRGDFLDEDDYQKFPPEPPTRSPALVTMTLSPMAAPDGSGGALLLQPAGGPPFDTPLGSSGWKVRGAVEAGVGIVLPFGESPITGLGADPHGKTMVELYYDDEPSTLVDPKTPFAFHAARVRIGVEAVYAGDGELKAWLRLERARLSLGRLPVLELLAPEGFGVDIDVGLVASTRDGLRLEGGGKAELLIPVDKLLLGFLRIRQLRIRWVEGEEDEHKTFRIEVTATIGLELKSGFRFYLEGVGGDLRLVFARNQPMRFASLADFTSGFVGPIGIAASCNFYNKVIGGGYLRREPGTEKWVGAGQLSVIDKFSIEALFLRDKTEAGAVSWLVIASLRLPGGSPGITIRGISVIFGTNRTSSPDAFLSGLRTGDLDALMFPDDPIGRGAQYAAALNRLLPLLDGSEVIGLAVMISALRDRLTVELGFLYDSGGPNLAAKLYVIGQVHLVFPKKKVDVARIHADFVAIYDRERGELLVLAELRDSRLFGGELTGQILFFRGDPDLMDAEDEFVSLFAAGGFHPSYQLPGPRVPAPKRIRMLVQHGDRIRIDGQFYFALTSTSLQFGAAMELRARFAGFGIRARLVLDVLFESLHRWEITVQASVEILLGSRTLAGVSLKGVLTGFMPGYLVGTASVSFLFWSFSKSFTATLVVTSGEPDDAEADPAESVVAALTSPRAWDTGGAPGLSLRDVERDGVWLSPSAPLRVRQDVAPLDVPLDRFGAAELSVPLTLRLEDVGTGTDELEFDAVTAEFAPAIYQNLSEEEKLSGAGFAHYPAGFSLRRGHDHGGAVDGDTSYEEIVLDSRQPSRRSILSGFGGALDAAVRALDDGARGIAPRSGKKPVRIRAERFAVVDASLAPIAAGLDTARARAIARTRGRAIVVPEANL